MALKFLDGNGEGNTADAASAIDYAVGHGARVINASWGGPAFSHALYSAVKRAGEQGVAGRRRRRQRRRERGLLARLPGRASTFRTSSRSRPPTAPTGSLDFSNYGAEDASTSPRPATTSTRPSRPSRTRAATPPSAERRWPRRSWPARPPSTCRKYPTATVDQLAPRCCRSVDRLPTLAGKTVTGGRLNLAQAARRGVPVRRRPRRDTTPPSPFSLIRPRNRLETPQARRCGFAWQRSRDSSGIRVYRAVRGRQEVQDRARTRTARAAATRKPRTRFRLRGRQAPLVRAGLRLRRQPAHQPRVQALQARARAACCTSRSKAAQHALSGGSPAARRVQRGRLAEALQLHLADRLELQVGAGSDGAPRPGRSRAPLRPARARRRAPRG